MKLFLIAMLAILPTTLRAQLTPDAYIDQVVEFSWEIKMVDNAVGKADANIAYAKSSYLPDLSASGSFSHGFRNLSGGRDWSFAMVPQISQTIYGGGVVRANVEQAKLSSQVARYSAENYTLEVRYAAEYAYWSLWATNRYYQAMSQYVDIIRRESEVIDRRYREGYITKGDKLMIEARLSEAEYELTSSEQRRLQARNNLNILRGRPTTDSVAMVKISPDSMCVPMRMTISEVLDQRPDYSAVLLNERIASAATRATRGAYNPTLAGGVAGSWRTYTPNMSGSTYLDGMVFVELSVPICHFGERRKVTAMSRADERTSVLNSAILLDSITKEESNAWVSVVESRAQMSAAARSLRIASENLDISTYAYNEGEVSIVELMQAQISWIQIYTNAIDSECNYEVALAYYRRVVGQMWR